MKRKKKGMLRMSTCAT